MSDNLNNFVAFYVARGALGAREKIILQFYRVF